MDQKGSTITIDKDISMPEDTKLTCTQCGETFRYGDGHECPKAEPKGTVEGRLEKLEDELTELKNWLGIGPDARFALVPAPSEEDEIEELAQRLHGVSRRYHGLGTTWKMQPVYIKDWYRALAREAR